MVKVNDLSQIYRIIFDSPVPTEQIVNIIKTSPDVEYAEGPIIAYETISPNDPWYSDNNYHWSFDVINAEGAWDITTGSPLIGIGINDLFGGVPQLHEDLVGKVVWDDLNGNYGNHGIITAGVAGAATNNNMDIASLGWNVNLLLAHWGVNGIYNLVRNGADIINFSWVTTSYSSSLADAIQYALQNGRVCVASAGNNEPPVPGVRYPAAYNFGELGQVIAVSGTEIIDGVEQFIPGFNYSPGTDPIGDPTNAFIDCSAPGTNYRALNPDGPTGTTHIWAGTSISSPFVAAMVGLMLSVNSTLTPVQVYNIINSTTDRIGNHSYDSLGWNQWLGYGRIDAANAVNVANGHPPKPREVNVEPSANLHPYLTWESSGQNLTYKIYKYVTYEAGWFYLAQTVSTYYEDLTEDYCPPGQFCTKGHNVRYRIVAVDNSNKESVPSLPVTAYVLGGNPNKINTWNSSSRKPIEYSLSQNYPNPFNPSTEIKYTLSEYSFVTLKIYDMLGKEVAVLVNGNKPAGNYSVEFNAVNLPSGVYIYKLTAGKFSSAKKLMLMK